MKKIGIDIGGTFTDLILQDEKNVYICKVPSIPGDPAKAAVIGLREITRKANTNVARIDLVAHGTTISTNAVIERKGAKTALITTKGFKDIIEIGRLARPPEAIYNIQYEKPEALVPRYLRFQVDERVNYQGKIIRKLEEDDLKSIIQKTKEEKVNSIAVCLLFSYLCPDHERRIKDLIKRTLPDLYVVLSSDILPEFREYERTSATVINAYLGPLISAYLERMKDDLQKDNLAQKFYIMQSNGGLTTPEVCLKKPSTTILSGPAAGVVGAAYLAELAGFDNIISIDMGGTSFDVSVVRNGQPIVSTAKKILDSPLVIPMIDIQTIGAGGGSIAWIDLGGVLRVGPQSAGADPGPACYGLGGEEPTVTDADMVLGFLNPYYFLGGRVEIFVDKALDAIQLKIADKLGISPMEAAEGIYRIVNANMSGVTRVVSVEKGYDPRDFALIAFGGAGPVHAAEIAKELEIPWTIVPPYPGVTSAYGLVVTDLIHDYVQTFLMNMKRLELHQMNEAYERLEWCGNEDLSKDGIRPENRKFNRSADMRYLGQVYTLNVEASGGELNDQDVEKMVRRFNDSHESIYGFKVEGEPIEIVNLRVKAIGIIRKLKPKKNEEKKIRLNNPLKGKRKAYFLKNEFMDTSVYDREKLLPGDVIRGPAIIEQIDSTIVIPLDFIGTVDGYFNVIMGKKEWRGHA